MVDPNDGPAPEARPPGVTDLVSLCRSLNREGAQYIVIGGMAMIQAGFVRATEDIDLLVDPSPDNLPRLRRALSDLPDRAVRDMADTDLDHYVVVRVADEIVVDLMKAACGITFGEASDLVDMVSIEGVAIRSPSRRCSGGPNKRCATRIASTACSWPLCSAHTRIDLRLRLRHS